jgi:hypothetical protein
MDDDVAYVRVVGVSHYQEALERCSAGEAVKFVHEPDNPYDETALRIDSSTGETIGYVPRASWLHRMVHEKGRGVSAAIASLGYGRSCQLGATISVAVCDDEVAIASYHRGQPAPEPPREGFRYWIKRPSGAAQLVEAQK